MRINGLNFEDLEDEQLFFEELAIGMAQELIAEAMEEKELKKADLARILGKTKSYVTGILSSGRNLIVRTLARILFSLGNSVEFGKTPIKGQENPSGVCDQLHLLFQNWVPIAHGATDAGNQKSGSLKWETSGPINEGQNSFLKLLQQKNKPMAA